jgi:hypothetical protein
MSVTTLQGHQQDSAATDTGSTREPRDLAPWFRRAGQILALLSLPGAGWPLWELLRSPPWAEQDWAGRLGQTTWIVLLLLISVGAVLAFRNARSAGQLLLTIGSVMLAWVGIGRLGDAEHWAAILPLALLALILPTLAAAALLLLAARADKGDPALA